mgnify:CR=1 FL=1
MDRYLEGRSMTSYFSLFSLEAITQIIMVFSVAFYFVECFFGYKCIKVFVLIAGFLIGFLVGFFITLSFYLNDAYIPAAVGIGVGILLALVAFKLYLVGVFIFCGAIAAQAVTCLPLSGDGAEGIIKTVLCIAAFIVVGILAVKFAKLCIVLVTAVTGAINAINLLRTPIAVLDNNTIIRFAVIAAVAIAGITVQRLTTRRS